MDPDEYDIEVLRLALAEERALGLRTGSGGDAAVTPAAPGHAPAGEAGAQQIDLAESTDALRAALEAERRRAAEIQAR